MEAGARGEKQIPPLRCGKTNKGGRCDRAHIAIEQGQA